MLARTTCARLIDLSLPTPTRLGTDRSLRQRVSVLSDRRPRPDPGDGRVPDPGPGRVLHAYLRQRCGLLFSSGRVCERSFFLGRGLLAPGERHHDALFRELRGGRSRQCPTGRLGGSGRERLLSPIRRAVRQLPVVRRRLGESQDLPALAPAVPLPTWRPTGLLRGLLTTLDTRRAGCYLGAP